MSTPCPSSEILKRFIVATLDDLEVDALIAHLESCSSCAKRLRKLEQTPKDTIVAGFHELREKSLHAASALPARIDKYEILEKIGEGGMGTVYRAKHPNLQTDVAVKTLKASRLDNPTDRSRFKREIEAAGRLRHENIVQAIDAGIADDVLFIVMELLDGCDLGQHVEQNGPIRADQALSLIRQAATGLGHAHAAGLVHRDIKPSNLFLTRNGIIKLLDLGIARSVGDENRGKQTETGYVIGSPDFMAPEQFRGAPVDARSDIYSLGCTLAYLLTGKALSESLGDLPKAVRSLVAKMTAGMPDERFQSTGELVKAIDSLSTTGQRWGVKGKQAVIGVAVAFALCIIVVWFFARDGNEIDQRDIPDATLTPRNEAAAPDPPEPRINSAERSAYGEKRDAHRSAMAQYKEELGQYGEAMKEWQKTKIGDPPLSPLPPDPPPDAPEEPYAPSRP